MSQRHDLLRKMQRSKNATHNPFQVERPLNAGGQDITTAFEFDFIHANKPFLCYFRFYISAIGWYREKYEQKG